MILRKVADLTTHDCIIVDGVTYRLQDTVGIFDNEKGIVLYLTTKAAFRSGEYAMSVLRDDLIEIAPVVTTRR